MVNLLSFLLFRWIGHLANILQIGIKGTKAIMNYTCSCDESSKFFREGRNMSIEKRRKWSRRMFSRMSWNSGAKGGQMSSDDATTDCTNNQKVPGLEVQQRGLQGQSICGRPLKRGNGEKTSSRPNRISSLRRKEVVLAKISLYIVFVMLLCHGVKLLPNAYEMIVTYTAVSLTIGV